MTHPFNLMIRKDATCLICGARGMGSCSCWENCSCSWTKPRGGLCSNAQCRHRTATEEDRALAVELKDEELQALAAICASGDRGAMARRIRLELDPRQSIHDIKKLLAHMTTSGLLIARGRYYEPSLKGMASLLAIAEGSPP